MKLIHVKPLITVAFLLFYLPISKHPQQPLFLIFIIEFTEILKPAVKTFRFTGNAYIPAVKYQPVMGNREKFFRNVFYKLFLCIKRRF